MTIPKKIAIVQSSYLPRKGSIDLATAVDEFILYHDMQRTRRDWRNRDQTTHGAAVFDLLFNCGREAPDYMRYVRA
jgi:hypothetical protein